jgi:hypothetical protein
MQQGGDPQQLVEMLQGFMQQAQADEDKLSQMHTAMLSHLMELLQGAGDQGQGGGLAGPGGPGAPQDQGPPPVGSRSPAANSAASRSISAGSRADGPRASIRLISELAS